MLSQFAVNELFERWPALAALAHLPLAELPTPVEEMSRVSAKVDSSVWIKRDDLSGSRYGGNKVRKLEFLLGRARQKGADTLITCGGVGSHHVFATAFYGREHGFETHAVLTSQPYHPHVEDQLRADLAVGAHLHTAKSVSHLVRKLLRLTALLRLQGKHPYVIPFGGSNVWGTLGLVNAGLEVASQIDAGLCLDPDAVYVACGSCATAAGIALGMAAGGVDTKVIAVRATDRWLANPFHVRRLIYRAQHVLRHVEPRFPDVAARAFASVQFDHAEFGKGYGLSTPASEAAEHLAASAGITLDPTYTGKALASLLRDAENERRGQKLLFWNTLSSAPMTPFLDGAGEAPEEFVRLLTLQE
jgi:1-aminocyclopropane-1-carboxylate deaminase/D-cysteine desulfhydrase-like pyridoxal-dependent ACC family enzyme